MDEKDYIIKNSDTVEVLFNRLKEWNAHNTTWLSADRYNAFVALYAEFQRLHFHFPLDFYDELSGWECGLYQVLDIRQQRICEMLPCLLTAYMYNYVRKRVPFVQRFLNTKIPCTWKSSDFLSPSPYLIGKCPDNDSMRISDIGIGKLLSELGGATETELKRYANAFSFPKVQKAVLMTSLPDGTAIITSEYIIPEKGKSLFYRDVHKKNWRTDSGEKAKKEWYAGKQFEFSPSCLLMLGYRWMYIVSTLMSRNNQQHSTSFACEPNLYECYLLLLSIVDPDKQVVTQYDSMNASEREDAIKKNLAELFQSK